MLFSSFTILSPALHVSSPGTVVSGDWKNHFQNVARCLLCQTTMSSFDSTEEKRALPVELNGVGIRENRPPDADRHISFALAHELNNILTVVQGHADRLFVKHQEDAVLGPNLKKIADAARRAAELVRTAPRLDFNPPTA